MYVKLLAIGNQFRYRVRYCITFFPDLVYKTNFLEYVYKKASYQNSHVRQILFNRGKRLWSQLK